MSIIFAKNSVTDVIYRVLDTPRRVYFHSICLGDHFLFRISHFNETYVYGYPKTCLGFYLTSMREGFFCKVWTNLSKFVAKFWWIWTLITSKVLNPFVPNAPFLYPLKTLENFPFFWCFKGVEKGCFGNEWVTINLELFPSGFHNHIVFHNTDSSWFPFIDLSKFFFLALCDNLAKSLESNTKVYRWL